VATTTIHMPTHLLRALDAVAARRKASRNRLLTEACRRLVDEDRGAWPAGFFEMTHLSEKDRRELARAGREMDKAIRGARRRGTRIDDMDLAVAAIALAHGLGVATCNARHFNRLEGLRVLDWSKAARS